MQTMYVQFEVLLLLLLAADEEEDDPKVGNLTILLKPHPDEGLFALSGKLSNESSLPKDSFETTGSSFSDQLAVLKLVGNSAGATADVGLASRELALLLPAELNPERSSSSMACCNSPLRDALSFFRDEVPAGMSSLSIEDWKKR